MGKFQTYVKYIENYPWRVADEEDDDDENENLCDSLVPSMSVGGSLVGQTGVPDDPEGEAIENNEEEEGDEGHDDKISNEKKVSAVSVVISEGCSADPGID